MKLHIKLQTLLIAVTLASSIPAWASDHEKGANGGRVIEAGNFHVELVAKDTSVEVYLTDSKDKAMAPAGYKGTAILMVDGKAQRIVLTPDQARLIGTSPVALPAQPKGVVQITKPDGKTNQAKFP